MCGCEAALDSWQHYSGCAGLWAIAFTTAGVPPIFDVAERLHVLTATSIGLKITAVAFGVYHKSKDRIFPVEFDELEHTALIAWRELA